MGGGGIPVVGTKYPPQHEMTRVSSYQKRLFVQTEAHELIFVGFLGSCN